MVQNFMLDLQYSTTATSTLFAPRCVDFWCFTNFLLFLEDLEKHQQIHALDGKEVPFQKILDNLEAEMFRNRSEKTELETELTHSSCQKVC